MFNNQIYIAVFSILPIPFSLTFYICNAVIQKQMAATSESGDMMHFSFLLIEMRFKKVFSVRYIAIAMPIIFVPLVNSPNGNPHIISIDMIITIEKTPAPIKDIIILFPENPNHIRHPALTFHQTQRLSLPKFYDEMFSILLLAI